MADYRFKPRERWAVFTMHGGKCWQCSRPIDLKSMQVDHIIPENHGLSPEKYSAVLADFLLPATFNLNSYENWLPACGPCNSSKGAMIFDASPMIQKFLQKAREKASQARALEAEAISERKIANALRVIEQSAEDEAFNLDLIKPLVMKYAVHNMDAAKALLAEIEGSVVEFQTFGHEVHLARPELRITPFYSVLYKRGDVEIVRTPRGVGYRSAAANPHSSYFCGHCGSNGPWNGAICLTCGHMDDGD